LRLYPRARNLGKLETTLHVVDSGEGFVKASTRLRRMGRF